MSKGLFSRRHMSIAKKRRETNPKNKKEHFIASISLQRKELLASYPLLRLNNARDKMINLRDDIFQQCGPAYFSK
jgi:hypothetical protein